MSLTITQTITAIAAPQARLAYPPDFPALSVDGQPMKVAATARSGVGIAALLNLVGYMPKETIAYANVWLMEAAGIDPYPMSRLWTAPVLIGRPPRQIRQELIDLVSGGQYVLFAQIRTPAGRELRFTAPFVAFGDSGNYLLTDGVIPEILATESNDPFVLEGN